MIDWNTTAFLFPGQGSQVIGMGADIAQVYPETQAVYDEADKMLNFPLSKLCWEGPAGELTATINTQPALYVTGMATLRALEQALEGGCRPAYMAGHSLGEITALAASGAVSFGDGLRLVRERGRLMQGAGDANPGGMAAVVGLRNAAQVVEACKQASDEVGAPVVLANDNCPGQHVISGDAKALERASALCQEAGARRVIPLEVSAAFHSPLMEKIADSFSHYLVSVPFHTPGATVIGNATAAPLINPESIHVELATQITSRVRWTESIEAMRDAGITTFVEIGPKDVLTGLLRRIDRKAKGIALNSADAVQAFIVANRA
jgi:[acyl-carrier-protein] S-malonyltransferase